MKYQNNSHNDIPEDKKIPGRIYEEGAHYDSLGRKVVNIGEDFRESNHCKKEEPPCYTVKKLLGKTVSVKFTDLSKTSYGQRIELMGEWTQLRDRILKPYIVMLLLAFVAAAFSFIINSFGAGIIKSVVLLLFILCYTMIRLNELPGFILHIVLNVVWFCLTFDGDSILTVFSLIALSVMTYSSVMCAVCLVNFKLYKSLSKLDGFPSFIRNTSDSYGDKLHETDIVKADHTKDDSKIHLKQTLRTSPGENMTCVEEDRLNNLKSYAEKNREIDLIDKNAKNTTEKGWNAFDYLDNKSPKGENDNENGN